MSMQMAREMENTIRSLRTLREQKAKEMDDIDKTIAHFLAVMQSIPEAQGALLAQAGMGDKYVNMSIPQAAEQFLRERGEPALTREITDALLQNGIRTKAKNFEATTYSILREAGGDRRTFRRTPDGRAWWLMDMPLPNDRWGSEAKPVPPKTRVSRR